MKEEAVDNITLCTVVYNCVLILSATEAVPPPGGRVQTTMAIGALSHLQSHNHTV
jgi:hypothetical protein